MSLKNLILLLLIAAFCLQCTKSEPLPAEAFTEAETNVLVEGIKTTYQASSTGAFEINLTGRLEIKPGVSVLWTSEGVFGGRGVDFTFSADSDSVFYTSQSSSYAQLRPGHLDEAIVKGLFRMGIMHNLAVLSAGKLPDRAQSDSIDQWLDVQFHQPEQRSDTLSFDVVVNGNPTAKAKLKLKDGKPVYRWQHVEMGGGMTVIESFDYE